MLAFMSLIVLFVLQSTFNQFFGQLVADTATDTATVTEAMRYKRKTRGASD